MKHLLTLAIAVAALAGCASNDTIDDVDVNPDKIYGHYTARFSAESNDLSLTAQLRVGGDSGTSVRLTSPASMTVDGDTMRVIDGDESAVNLSGTYYYLNRSVATPPEGYSFTWTRNDGQAFTNVVEQAKPIAVAEPTAGAQVPRTAALTIAWAEAADGQRVTAHVDTKVERNTTFAIKSVTSGDSLVISADDMADFPAGPATIHLERWASAPTTEGHPEGGKRESTYTSQKIEIEITE